MTDTTLSPDLLPTQPSPTKPKVPKKKTTLKKTKQAEPIKAKPVKIPALRTVKPSPKSEKKSIDGAMAAITGLFSPLETKLWTAINAGEGNADKLFSRVLGRRRKAATSRDKRKHVSMLISSINKKLKKGKIKQSVVLEARYLIK